MSRHIYEPWGPTFVVLADGSHQLIIDKHTQWYKVCNEDKTRGISTRMFNLKMRFRKLIGFRGKLCVDCMKLEWHTDDAF